jgi:hypothetical protein
MGGATMRRLTTWNMGIWAHLGNSVARGPWGSNGQSKKKPDSIGDFAIRPGTEQ